MIPAAELKVRVAIEGIPQGNMKLSQFEGRLKEVSRQDATATLRANVEGRGFEEYEAYIGRARMQTGRPITQKVKADVDEGSFASAYAEIAALKAAIDDAHGGGIGAKVGGVLTPFGKLGTAAALATPEVYALVGATGALAASLSEAALGAGALAIGAGGMGVVGLAGIASVAVPAVAGLKEVTKAQQAYTKAVATYGAGSTQAVTASRKLAAAEREAGKEATAVVEALGGVKERWAELSRPGREAFLGTLADGLQRLESKLPVLSRSANRSTREMRRDFDLFFDEVTGRGSGFDRFMGEMTDLFVREGPMVTHILADWVRILEHLAEAAGAPLEEVTERFSRFSDRVLESTENAPKLRREVAELVDQTLSWVRLLGEAGDLIITLFGAGDQQGQALVESMTRKLEAWKRAIEADPEGVETFFADSIETTKELGELLEIIIRQGYVLAKAMEPVVGVIHDLSVGLDSIRVGNISALSALLGGIATVAIGKKLLELQKLVTAYSGIRTVLKGEAALTDILAGSQARAAATANAEAAANARLATSLQGVTAARSELLIANASGTVVGTAADVRAGATAAKGGAIGGVVSRVLSSPFAKAGAVAGGYFAAEFGAKAIEGITGEDFLEDQNLFESLTHGFNTSKQQGKLSEEEGNRKAFDLNPELDAEARVRLERQYEDMMGDLAVSTAGGMGKINAILDRELDLSSALWARGSDTWRERTADAMRQAVTAIRAGIENGTINAERGQKRINQLLSEIHLVRGDDPFGLAKATTESFKQANEITAQGTNAWIRKLERMPPAAARNSAEMTIGMLREWAKGHPKLEAQIDALTAYEIRKFGATNKQLRQGVRRGATGPIADAFRQMALGSSEALDNLGINVNRMLKALGANNMVEFQALVLTGSRGRFPDFGKESGSVKRFHSKPSDFGFRKQAGGHIVPGVTEGDSVQRMVRPNTFILNREAARAFFQAGGHVPVVLEPGEIEFPPEAVDRIGLGTLMAMNEAVPRFATGGEVTGKVSGPRALAEIGHAALGRAFDAAQRYIDRHRPKQVGAGPLGTMRASGSVGGHPELQPGISAIAATILKRFPGLVITSTTGGGHAANSFHYAGRAVDIGGSAAEMLRAAAWIRANLGAGLTEGIHNPNLSIDSGHAVPPSFWGAATWAGHADHIHVAKQRGGVVGLQRGGAAAGTKHDSNLSPFEQKVNRVAGRAWAHARHLYPGAGSQMPSIYIADGLHARNGHIGEVKPSAVAPYGRMVYLDRHWAGRLVNGANYAEGLLLHEWAHVFQEGLARKWEIEGGATDFQRYASPLVFGNGPGLYPAGYQGFAKRVEREKGWPWIKRGQFGFQHGGVVGLQRGGKAEALEENFHRALKLIWPKAARFYGRSPHSPIPETIIEGLTASAGATFRERGAPYGKTVSLTPAAALGVIGLGEPSGRGTLLHEWAHVFQDPGMALWEREGGAEAFKMWAGPKIFPGRAMAGAFGSRTAAYERYKQHVLKAKPDAWIHRGQFKGLQRGGRVGGGYTAADVKARTGHIDPFEVGIAMLLGGFPRSAQVLSEGMGTVKGENNFTLPNNAQGPNGHIGLWSESPAFGSVAERLNPILASKAAYRVGWLPRHSFYDAWGRWQAEQSGRDGAKAFGPEFVDTAEKVLAGEVVSAGGSTERSPEPKHVKGRYVRHKKGSTDRRSGGTYGEDVHGHYKATTERLNFGSLPEDLGQCTKEISHRRNQLREYRAALRDAGDNRVRHDLEVNIQGLEDRIRKLRRQRIKLVREQQRKKREAMVKARVAGIESAAEFAYWTDPHTGVFAREEAAFELAEERASQSVALEPEEPRIPASASANETRDRLGQWINSVLAPYVDGTETARYRDVLGVEASWRNQIIGAEAFAQKRMDDWRARIDHLHDRIEKTRERIHHQRERIRHLKDRIETIQGYRKDHPRAWRKHRGEIPDLRKKIHGLRGKIGREQDEIPGFQQIMKALRAAIVKTRSETLPEWEQSLGGIQGLGRTHEVLPSLPGEPSNQFGGNIFQTQMTIHELGLKVPNAIAALPEAEKPEGPDRTEQLELELQLSKQANQRLAVENLLGPTLTQFERTYPIEVAPWMGAFAEGGVALVGEKGPELAHFPSGTRIHSAAETQQMLASAPSLVVRINGHVMQHPGDDRDLVEAVLNDRRLEAKIEQGARDTRAPLATPGGRHFLS